MPINLLIIRAYIYNRYPLTAKMNLLFSLKYMKCNISFCIIIQINKYADLPGPAIYLVLIFIFITNFSKIKKLIDG